MQKSKDQIIEDYWKAFNDKQNEIYQLKSDKIRLIEQLAGKQAIIDRNEQCIKSANKSISDLHETYHRERMEWNKELSREQLNNSALTKEIKRLKAQHHEVQRQLDSMRRLEKQRQETRNLMWICRAIFESPPLKA
jgi:hypothetical protein